MAFLLIAPSGGKWWRLKYRFGGKEKLLSLGTFPEISLADARERRNQARKLLANDIDPGEHRKLHKASQTEADAHSFEAIAREWFSKFSPAWAPTHADKILRRLERDVFPWLGKQPVSGIAAPALLTAMRRIEHRGAIETAHRALQNCSQVFRYAIATGRAEPDPAADLRGALPPSKATHLASITDPKAVGELLRAINGYQGSLIAKCALRLAPLVFVRPDELRKAEWTEFNFDAAEWRIPAERMEMRAQHIAPSLYPSHRGPGRTSPIHGPGRYVFPGARSNGRPMSENTVNAALRRLGYASDQMTGHGFRSMASTLLNERGRHCDAVERQLAHAERDTVRAAYNYAEHLPERRKMMQAWADFHDALTDGRTVAGVGFVDSR